MVRVGILGPTGYTGLELLRLLLRHPEAEIVYLGTRRDERPPISEIWPVLRGRLDMRCSLFEKDPVPKMDLAFLALPHTLAMNHVPALLKSGVRVVDISADYRLKDPAAFKKWYKVEHKDPANLQHAVYGLSELFRDEIKRARLIANPGCYATAIQLALAPLLLSHMASPDAPIIADAKSGVSGAGRDPRPDLHFPEANESVSAYKVGVHQHTGEILQSRAADRRARRGTAVRPAPDPHGPRHPGHLLRAALRAGDHAAVEGPLRPDLQVRAVRPRPDG